MCTPGAASGAEDEEERKKKRKKKMKKKQWACTKPVSGTLNIAKGHIRGHLFLLYFSFMDLSTQQIYDVLPLLSV